MNPRNESTFKHFLAIEIEGVLLGFLIPLIFFPLKIFKG